MAMSDYYQCDSCGRKTFYDAECSYTEVILNLNPILKSGWQPIETAPEKALLLLYEPHDQGGFMFVGVRVGTTWRNNLDLLEQHPTHWMPLPESPEHG